jgi:hypothetical protein
MNTLDLVTRAIEALHLVQKVHPEAIIAGGFLRDITLGHMPKDLDIFITELPHEDFDIESLRESFPNVVWEDFSNHMEYFSNEVKAVAKLGNIDTDPNAIDMMAYSKEEPRYLPIQLIVLQSDITPIERVSLFDIGLCQVWSDGKVTERLPVFQEDFFNKKITILDAEDYTEFSRSINRAIRFAEKYSFVIDIPTRLKFYEEQWRTDYKNKEQVAVYDSFGAATPAYVNQ